MRIPRLAIVASRFNEPITRRLLEGCVATLLRRGVPESRLTLVWVPGAFEIPLVAKRLAASRRYAAVICLGAVIRGETFHFEVVAREAAAGIAAASRETGVPCILGVLTTDTEAQALRRSGRGSANRGAQAALAALEMAELMAHLGGRAKGA